MKKSQNSMTGLFPTPVMTVPQALAGSMLDALVERIREEQRETNVHTTLLSHTKMVSASDDPLKVKIQCHMSDMVIFWPK